MKINKKKVILISASILLIFAYFFIPRLTAYLGRQAAAEAAGGFPYQIGLTSVKIIQCQLSCCSVAGCRCCTGGTLCSTLLTEVQCTTHSDVSGTQAGGMGNNALFSQTAISQAGLAAGGQLIAAGMSSVLMDSGVLASSGGCSGCTAKQGKTGGVYAFFERLNNFIIAGKRESEK